MAKLIVGCGVVRLQFRYLDKRSAAIAGVEDVDRAAIGVHVVVVVIVYFAGGVIVVPGADRDDITKERHGVAEPVVLRAIGRDNLRDLDVSAAAGSKKDVDRAAILVVVGGARRHEVAMNCDRGPELGVLDAIARGKLRKRRPRGAAVLGAEDVDRSRVPVGVVVVRSPDHNEAAVDRHRLAEVIALYSIGRRQLGHQVVRGAAIARMEDLDRARVAPVVSAA